MDRSNGASARPGVCGVARPWGRDRRTRPQAPPDTQRRNTLDTLRSAAGTGGDAEQDKAGDAEMKKLHAWLPALLVLVLVAGPAWAFVPQTIVIDGTNDFDSGNLLDADGGDTQFTELDQGNIYLTNDSNFLYFGFDYDHGTWTDINLGIAIDTNSAAGGTSDPFGRAIAWNTVPKKPDFIVYDVIPTSANTYNYEVLYQWNGSAWSTVQDGSDGLGIADGTFTEGKLALSTLGLAAGDTLHIEFWVTQEGSTKGPLDAACSDAVQLSTPSGTVWDTTSAVEMSCMFEYVVLSTADTTPPTVESVKATGFGLTTLGEIELTTDKVDVQFSEPVGTGAATPGNYSISNTSATVTGAVVDGTDASIVHLTLSAAIGPSANFYDVTVVNVQDLAGNPIVNNGTDNVGSFFFKKLRFEGDMSVFLLTHSSPPDSFTVEGSLYPLTFTPRDNALMQDPDVDSVYVTNVPLSVSKDKGTGKAEASLEWKFYHHVQGWEPRGNRQHLVSSDNGEVDTLFAYWNDDLPSDVVSHPVDVCFQVDASLFNPGPNDTVGVTGDQPPLPNFATPGILMKDDGVAPDQTAGDGIYAVYVRFDTGTYKNVNYKFTFNSGYECIGQDNRNVYLNDAEFDTVGGANGPLVLPARGIDRCTVTDKDIKVIFRVDTDYWFWDPITSVGINGSQPPLNFNIPSETLLSDDGIAPDATASDDTFTVAVIFPDSTNFTVEYKYVINDQYECAGYPNRTLTLDDVNYDTTNPMTPPVGIWDYCSDITTGVPADLPRPKVTLHLAQNYPNPFGPRTSIEFRTERGGDAVLEIYDVAGRKVRTLLNGPVDPGLHIVQWNGRDDSGRGVKQGVYFYTLRVGTEQVTRRMVVVQ